MLVDISIEYERVLIVLKVAILGHVDFETPGIIENWIHLHHYEMQLYPLFKDHTLPTLQDFDLLVVLGGPMNIYDDEDYSWLTAEKNLISSAIKENKAVLGICLGAQLIADQLGAPVTANQEKEAGWFPVIRNQELDHTALAEIVPPQSLVFHWHGDTFALPTGATSLWHSEGCANQGFIYNDRVIGTQFHFEVAEENVRSILQHDGDYLASGGIYVQTKEEIAAQAIPTENEDVLFGLLDYITKGIHK